MNWGCRGFGWEPRIFRCPGSWRWSGTEPGLQDVDHEPEGDQEPCEELVVHHLVYVYSAIVYDLVQQRGATG